MKPLLMTTLFLVFALLNTLALAADEPSCREESLIRFVSAGEEVSSELVGGENACDDFGGNLAYSPQHQRRIFVNFNIAGMIDLDEVDAAYAQVPADSRHYGWISKLEIAVVTQEWLHRVHQTEAEAVLNMTGSSLFVSEVVVKDGRFGALLNDFYGAAK